MARPASKRGFQRNQQGWTGMTRLKDIGKLVIPVWRGQHPNVAFRETSKAGPE